MAEAQSTVAQPTRAFVIHPDMGDRRDQRRSPDLALEEAVALVPQVGGVAALQQLAQRRSPGGPGQGEEPEERRIPCRPRVEEAAGLEEAQPELVPRRDHLLEVL